MSGRTTTRHGRTLVVAALVVAGWAIVPTGAVLADEPVQPTASSEQPAPADAPAPEPAPEVGEVDGAVVAVGLPPVPPSSDESDESGEPQVAVGLPPVPPIVDEPQVAVGRPPVPPATSRSTKSPSSQSSEQSSRRSASQAAPPSALIDAAGAAFDLIDVCL